MAKNGEPTIIHFNSNSKDYPIKVGFSWVERNVKSGVFGAKI